MYTAALLPYIGFTYFYAVDYCYNPAAHSYQLLHRHLEKPHIVHALVLGSEILYKVNSVIICIETTLY